MRNEQFERDIEGIPPLHKKFSIVDTGEGKFLRGQLEIIDNSGRLWDTYNVEIKPTPNYPKRFPKLFETGNAFPKIADWHVYESDGSCCVDVPPSELIICKDGLHVADYIRRFAIPYFANQSFRRREGYYLYGEYSHGVFGRIEFYQSKLKAKSPRQLIEMLDLIIRGFNPPRTAFCPFCPKVKFRNCHRNAFRELSAIKPFLHFDGAEQLIPFFAANPDYKLPKSSTSNL